MTKLKDRVVLITGGGTGIGKAIAEACVAAEARVVVCGRREEPLRALCEALGDDAVWTRGDVSKPGDPARIVEAALAAFGKLDALVNNAGIFRMGALAETPDGSLEQIYRTNVIGLLAMTREAIRALTDTRGCVLNVSSVIGQGVLSHSVPYAGSKAAVEHITRCLAAELGPQGVRVNCVAPGTTETDMTQGLLADAQATANTVAGTPLGAVGKAEDIAPVAVHLISDEARWVTGQVVQVSGGLLL